jgi:hypothetical protein
MVNFGLNSASILGIFLAVAGASLYFLRSVRPELSRDHDIFFAAVGLLCGFILLFQGWRLDPILQFGQFLLTGSAIFFAVESIRLRGVATEQARRNTPIVDRERPVSRTRVYTEAELDQIEAYDYEGTPNYDSPRLRGYEEPTTRPPRRRREEPSNTRPPRSRSEHYSARERDEYNSRERENNPRRGEENQYPRSSRYSDRNDSWEQPDRSQESSFRNRPRSYWDEPSEEAKRPPRNRKPDLTNLCREYSDDESEEITTDYVDYQPLNSPDVDETNSDWEENQDYSSRKRPRRPQTEQERGNPINFDY